MAVQTEWTPPKQGREGRSLTMQSAPPTASEAREAMKEKVGCCARLLSVKSMAGMAKECQVTACCQRSYSSLLLARVVDC